MGKDDASVTIVGGRPMHRAVSTADLPVGLEQILTIAGMNYRFRERLLRDPAATAAEVGIELDAVELALLRSAGPERVAQLATAMTPSAADGGRRRFVKNVAASIAALVLGESFLLCSGCTGADGWERPDQGVPPNPDKGPSEPVQKMATLAGHLCYLYVPSKVLDQPKTVAPLLVALHDETETAISNVQRWAPAADNYGFSIVSVNWTEEPTSQRGLERLAARLTDISVDFASSYPVDRKRRYLASRGASTPIVYDAGFQQDSGFWAAAVFLGGAPLASCALGAGVKRYPPELVADPPALYYVIGAGDPDEGLMNDCSRMLARYGVETKVQRVAGETKTAVLKLGDIWEWLSQYTAGGEKG